MLEPKFVIFHQPKTAGTYASKCLPKNYVLPHHLNYHYCLTENMIHKKTKLVCIVRNILDYYISLITFWCLDPKYVVNIRNTSIDTLTQSYKIKKNEKIGHPNYWMSRGFTERNLVNILNNLFSDEFINEHKDKLSEKICTYDNYIFLIMSKLDIGFYTFSFLAQYSRKKVSDIQTPSECINELEYIYNNFFILNQNNISEELKNLCIKLNVPFTDNVSKQMTSNRKKICEYNIDDELISKIRHKERFIIEIFNLEVL